jgi:hypothetical protein
MPWWHGPPPWHAMSAVHNSRAWIHRGRSQELSLAGYREPTARAPPGAEEKKIY